MKPIDSWNVVCYSYGPWPKCEAKLRIKKLKPGSYCIILGKHQEEIKEKFLSIGFPICFETYAFNYDHDEGVNRQWLCIFDVPENFVYPEGLDYYED